LPAESRFGVQEERVDTEHPESFELPELELEGGFRCLPISTILKHS